MLYSVVLLAASAALASAQAWTYNSTTGVFSCPAEHSNGAYCAGNDGKSNIIIRCNNGVGQPGNCNDNLSGTFPIGLGYSPCYQSSETAGDAACSKNCIVYSGSGGPDNNNGNFPVPDCVPSTTASVASSTSASVLPSSVLQSASPSITSASVLPSSEAWSVLTTVLPSSFATPVPSSSVYASSSATPIPSPPVYASTTAVSASTSEPATTAPPSLTSASGEPPSISLSSSPSTVTTVITTTSVDDTTTVIQVFTTTYCPDSTLSTIAIPTTTGGISASPSNGTLPTPVGPVNNRTLSTGLNGSPTATPVGPTSTSVQPPPYTGEGVISSSAGTGLAILGLVIAYFL